MNVAFQSSNAMRTIKRATQVRRQILNAQFLTDVNSLITLGAKKFDSIIWSRFKSIAFLLHVANVQSQQPTPRD